MRFRARSQVRVWRILSAAATLMFVTTGIALGQSTMTRHTRLEVTSGQAKFVNRLPGTQILRLDIVLPLRDQAGLDSFLKEVYDPTSPIYRHFLTVPEFTERFGPTQEDYDAAVAFAKGRGFKVVGGSRDGMDVQVVGSVTVIEAAFNVAMGAYQHPTENRTFYAPDREPSASLGFPLWHISGLDNFSIPHPALVHKQSGAKPAATTGSGPSASFLGSDMRAAYYGGSLTGTGQNIGLFEYEGYDIADLNTYYTNAKQTNLSSHVVGISTDGTSLSCVYPSCDDTEQTLDMTQALGMAPGISALYVYVGSSDTAILSSITTHSPLPAQIGCSWGWSPADPGTDDPYYQRMAAQGQNFFVAAGDGSKWTSGNYPYPAEDAYVVTVGGTDLTTQSAGGTWASETAWSDSGGGISPDHIAIPSWQKLSGVITSSNGGSTSYRNGPDVAANANFTFYVCADQTTCTANEYGGTSFAAPMWAGYLALVNQQALLNGSSALGFINPLIYPLGVSSQSSYFHDITSGSNGYSAITGYDLVTGWGSPSGAGLINALAGTSSSPNFSLSASPGSVSVVQGNNGTSTITASISGGFNSAIALSASGQPSGVTVTFNPTSIAAPGSGTSTMGMAVASSTATGTYTITVTGTGGGVTRTTTVSLTVTAAGNPDFTISASPTSLTVSRGSSGSVTITTKVSGGFSSSVALSASGVPTGVSVSFTPSSIAAPGSGTSTMRITVTRRATISTHTITITGTGGGKTHTATVSLTT
jgi:subtilase family serine protease